VGLASSGLHANGFSLVRKVIDERGMPLDEVPRGLNRPLGEELLEPTAIYAPAVLAAARRGLIRSAAHITGGGIPENLPRALPPGLGARMDRTAWTSPPVFDLLAGLGGVAPDDMARTFNLGLGMILVADPARAGEAVDALEAAGCRAAVVGSVSAGDGVAWR
jgi:phosphoribosylformylglycinamidine cyclo-ligase